MPPDVTPTPVVSELPPPVLGAVPPVDKTTTDPAAVAPLDAPAWAEYVADPAKTAADNEAAKAEHDKTKPAEKAEGAPEAYEAFKLPDGVDADPAALATFQGVAKELNLTQAQAQKLVDMQASHIAKAAEAQQNYWVETNNKWVADGKVDKEFGGDKYEENVGVANSFLKEFGTPELTAALGLTGAGNHPEFIRLAYRAGRAMKEDKIVSGNVVPAQKSAQDSIYNHPTS